MNTTMEQALIFKLDGCDYAINSTHLVKIIRVPELTPLKYAHNAILGLCSVEGEIVPAFDSGQLLQVYQDNNSIDLHDDKARALVIKHASQHIVLVVEEVLENHTISDPYMVEMIDSDEDSIIGFMKKDNQVIQIVSVQKMVQIVELMVLQRRDKNVSAPPIVHEADNPQLTSKREKEYLIFYMGDEKFGIQIDTIREIIVYRDNIHKITNTPNEVLGLITIRDEVLPVIDLREFFHKQTTVSDKNRILIVRIENAYMGILIDTIEDILAIDEQAIESLPEKLKDEKVAGVAKNKDGLSTILSKSYLKSISHSVHAYLKSELQKEQNHINQVVQETTVEVAIFSLNTEEFAIYIEKVLEIIRREEISEIAYCDPYVKGMSNIRGEVIPIISLKQKLGLADDICQDGRILITNIADTKVGILVDSVNEIKEIDEKFIQRSNSENSVFSETIMLDQGNRVILKMEIENLFTQEELQGLSPIKEVA